MIDLDLSFERSAWEAALASMHPGDRISGRRFLALLEDEDDDAVVSAFADMAELSISVDISDLPADYGTAEQEARLKLEERLAKSGALPGGLDPEDLLAIHLRELAENAAVLPDSPVEGNLPLVPPIAVGHTGHGVLLMDLLQEGSLGLCEAAAVGGDPKYYIEQAMARCVILQARSGGLSRRICADMEDYRKADRVLLDRLGRTATLEEIAQYMGITIEAAGELADLFSDAKRMDLVRRGPEPAQESQEDELAVEDTAYFQTRQRISEMLSTLTEREAKLLTMRFGLEGGLPASPEEIGRKLGLTPEEVTAMEARALNKLRTGS